MLKEPTKPASNFQWQSSAIIDSQRRMFIPERTSPLLAQCSNFFKGNSRTIRHIHPSYYEEAEGARGTPLYFCEVSTRFKNSERLYTTLIFSKCSNSCCRQMQNSEDYLPSRLRTGCRTKGLFMAGPGFGSQERSPERAFCIPSVSSGRKISKFALLHRDFRPLYISVPFQTTLWEKHGRPIFGAS